jgi:hypothetical protein
MKSSKAATFLSAGVIATSLWLVPLNIPAQAQSNTGTTSTQQDRNVNQAGPISYNTERDHNNWGWLGLLGLTGLAGLAKKSRPATVHSVSNEPNIGVRSSKDFR